MPPSPRHLSPAETARTLGLSVRALRVYERERLLKPLRTASGWRAYGPDEIARLHQILALKQLGLPLRRIGELLGGRSLDVARLLQLQEQQLAAQQAHAEAALRLVRAAQAKLEQGQALSTEHLVQLIKETTMSHPDWTDAHAALAEQHFTPEQLQALRTRKFDAQDQQAASAAWAALIAEAERLRVATPPDAPEAADLARRWEAEVAKFTGGDAGLRTAAAGMYQAAYDHPEEAPQMPFSKEVWTYVAEAVRHARKDGR